MKIIRSIPDMRSISFHCQQQKRSIGFVPTMGALHQGHASLMQRARKENDFVVVSIFVNPLQFGPKEDLKKYPRTWESDVQWLKHAQVDAVFIPGVHEMYPKGFATLVDVPALAQTLCGPSRPGHFCGVATVVAKLFNMVRPTRAYFGEKDYQQVCLINRMVEDLQMPVRVVACPTVREPDGLACSSRNRYLSAKDREEAVKLYQALYLGRELVERRIMTQSNRLVKRLRGVLTTIPGGRIDYISVVDPVTLESMQTIRRPALLAAALWIHKTRLIDNVIIS
ncbi:MAG: pantoate--beta-alanine ligase [Elusimicrobiota bacterium]|jgi:pantoate--beta-alanine ligase